MYKIDIDFFFFFFLIYFFWDCGMEFYWLSNKVIHDELILQN